VLKSLCRVTNFEKVGPFLVSQEEDRKNKLGEKKNKLENRRRENPEKKLRNFY
jgi:hypothetical protein